MVLGMLPMAVFAEEGEGDSGSTTTPSTLSLDGADIVEITSAATITKTDLANASITVNPAKPLTWVEKNASIGRGFDGWWIGFKAVAPTSVTESNLSSVKYRNNGDASDKTTFAQSNDGKEGSNYYIQLWGGLQEAWMAKGRTITYVWYFNWDGQDTTGTTVEASKFNAGDNATATEMKGVDQIITLSFTCDDITLLDKDGAQVWPALPTVEVTPSEGETVATPEEQVVSDTIAAAKDDAEGGKVATFDVSKSEDATGVAIPKTAIQTAGTDQVRVAVATPNGTVTLGGAALTAIQNNTESGNVSIQVENKTDDLNSLPEADKPNDVNEDAIVGAYVITVQIGDQESGKITGDGWNGVTADTGDITLKLPAPEDHTDGTAYDIYLDGESVATRVAPVDGFFTVKVAHLSTAVIAKNALPSENTNLAIANIKPDVVGFAKVKVSGMISDRVYVIRLAKSEALDTDSILLVVDKVTEYEFTCKAGQNIYVLEFANKDALKGVQGEDGKMHLVTTSELPVHTAAVKAD